MTAPHQPAHHIRPHAAESNHSQLHDLAPIPRMYRPDDGARADADQAVFSAACGLVLEAVNARPQAAESATKEEQIVADYEQGRIDKEMADPRAVHRTGAVVQPGPDCAASRDASGKRQHGTEKMPGQIGVQREDVKSTKCDTRKRDSERKRDTIA